MATITKRPTTTLSIVEERNQWGTIIERHWENLDNIKNDNNNNAHTLQSYPIASGAGTVNKPGKIKATGFGFEGEFGSNTRINKVIFQWKEYARAVPWPGVTHVLMNFPYKDIKLLKANGGSDTGYKRHNIRVHNYSTERSLEFTRDSDMPSVRPIDISQSDFGVYFNPARNISGNTGFLFTNDFRVTVDYTDPTYTLNGSISSGRVLGEKAIYELTLTNTNNCHQGVNIPVTITLPAGLTYNSQSGDGYYDNTTRKWSAVLDGQGKATLKLTLDTTQQGTKSITATIDDFNISLTRSTVILPPTYTLESPNPLEVVHDGGYLEYPVTVKVNTSIITTAPVKITVPLGLAFVSGTGDGTATYNSTTREVTWDASFTNKTATMTFKWLGTIVDGQSDKYIQNLTVGNASLTKEVIVLRTDITTPYYSDYIIPNEVIRYMQDGETYTMSCWSIVTDKILPNVYPGDKNFTISILHDGVEYLSNKAITLDTPTRIRTTFPYTKNKGLTLRVYGQWLEINPWNATHEVGGFALYGIEGKSEYEPPAILFDNPDNLLLDGDYGYTVIDAQRTGSGVILEDIGFGGLEQDQEIIIKGFVIEGTVEVSDDVGMNITLHTDQTTSNRSIIIGKEDTTFRIGEKRDKWGLNRIKLENLEFELSLSNIGIDSAAVGLKDVRATLYYLYDETGGAEGFTLNGVHSREYSIFLDRESVDKPEGQNPNLKSHQLALTDGIKVISNTAEDKDIKINFHLVACDLEDANEKMVDITKWMTSKRDHHKEPVSKELIFDWDKDRVYDVILADEIDFDVDKFECTAKFIAPTGVARTPPKTTGAIGRNNGIIPIKPILTILCDGNPDGVDIREAYTGQYMKIRPTTPFPQNTILRVDFKNRTILDADGVDYMGAVTFDSYIIRILEQSEYDFTATTGAVVTHVEYTEAL